jgi:hypothetical protein
MTGDKDVADREYKSFRGCLAQLLDDQTLVGDVEGRWVIFKDGWVFGMATYASQDDAIAFGKQIFRDEPHATYIIVEVDAEKHALTAMHLLASALDGFAPPEPVADDQEDEG